MDTNDPNTATKWWRWNINGWGYTADAGQTYTIAATMNGAINADFITAGKISGIEIDNGSGTFKVTAAGNVTATDGSIGGWKVGTDKISAGSGSVYLSSNVSDYAFRTPNLQIGQNGDLQTTGKINLTSNTANIECGGDSVMNMSATGRTRFGYANNSLEFYKAVNGGVYFTLAGVQYQLSISGSGYLIATPV